jgi:hypothetical protein
VPDRAGKDWDRWIEGRRIVMPDLKEYLRSPLIQIAIAAGVSILALATSSVWLPRRPLDPLMMTIPALIEVVHGALYKKNKNAWYAKTWYWVCGIIVSTALLILLRALR